MPPANPILRSVHALACRIPPFIWGYRTIRDFYHDHPLANATWQTFFERGRLRLPKVDSKSLFELSRSIELPSFDSVTVSMESPIEDLIFLINLAKGRNARRILEVGTHLARTTYALHLNCPTASIVSYDIQEKHSRARDLLRSVSQVSLRLGSFSSSAEHLRKESGFDLIYVDGNHEFDAVIADSRLALELVAPGGVVIWHDYNLNPYYKPHLRVPEALEVISKNHLIQAVPGTHCAIHVRTV